jgi:hypothetical protein
MACHSYVPPDASDLPLAAVDDGLDDSLCIKWFLFLSLLPLLL